MLRLAFDFIITWRETRTRPNAYVFTAFSGIIVYIILWIVMPEKKYRDGYEDRMNDRLHNR